MSKLYELTQDLRGLQDLADDLDLSNGDASMGQAIEDTFQGLEMQFNDKAVAIIKVAENLKADTAIIDAEIKRLTDRKKAINNRQEALKDYLRYNMEASGIKKIECPLFTISLGKAPDKVQIIDESAIPDEFIRTKVEIAPDKVALAKALKDGKEIPGASLVQGKPSLRIA